MTAVVPDVPDELCLLAAVAGWARPFLRLDDVPVAFTPEWIALDLTDQRRAAAVVRAALAWWRSGNPVDDPEARIHTDLAGVGVYRPMAVELDVARQAARQPRPNDYTPATPIPAWDVDREEAA